jgi:hypothetical protein
VDFERVVLAAVILEISYLTMGTLLDAILGLRTLKNDDGRQPICYDRSDFSSDIHSDMLPAKPLYI